MAKGKAKKAAPKAPAEATTSAPERPKSSSKEVIVSLKRELRSRDERLAIAEKLESNRASLGRAERQLAEDERAAAEEHAEHVAAVSAQSLRYAEERARAAEGSVELLASPASPMASSTWSRNSFPLKTLVLECFR